MQVFFKIEGPIQQIVILQKSKVQGKIKRFCFIFINFIELHVLFLYTALMRNQLEETLRDFFSRYTRQRPGFIYIIV